MSDMLPMDYTRQVEPPRCPHCGHALEAPAMRWWYPLALLGGVIVAAVAFGVAVSSAYDWLERGVPLLRALGTHLAGVGRALGNLW